MAMTDPSLFVHQDLLPHAHLLSNHRYPTLHKVDLSVVVKWLVEAPKIARDRAPFFWTYLECPADGQIFLTWQPHLRRGAEFSTDGYIWAGNEMYYHQDAGNGLMVEIYWQRTGFRPNEQVAVHTRRRFRLVPMQPQAGQPLPNPPQVDPNLWIVQYGPADENARMPSHMIPITPQISQMMQARQQLLSMGQIARREFMLSDRASWPQLQLPGRGHSIYAAPLNQRGVPQTMAYPPHAGVPPPPKRGRPPAQAHPPPMGGAPVMEPYDDEEDTSRGDMFDNLTARDISMHRYRENHEWMEEVLSSPYPMGKIRAPDLGLGLKGELSILTEGIFEAPGVDAVAKTPHNPYVGRLDPELAETFRKRMEHKIADTKAELDALRAKHEKQIADFKAKMSVWKEAELDIFDSFDKTCPHWLRLEGRPDESDEGSLKRKRPNKKLSEIVAELEMKTGQKATTAHDVERIEAGGLTEDISEPEPAMQPPQDQPGAGPSLGMSRQVSQAGSQNSGVMIGDSDIDMGGTAAGLMDQMHSGFSSTSTPMNNFPTPQPQLSTIGTPANLNAPSPAPGLSQSQATPAGGSSSDVAMHYANKVDEWVVIPKPGGTPVPSAEKAPTPSATVAARRSASQSVSGAFIPGRGLGFDTNDFSGLGDLNTAGEALAGYGDDLAMDDSAFVEAFHDVNVASGGTGGGS